MARQDKAALSDPLTLACHLDERVVRRPHLEVISSAIAQLTPGGGDRVMIICPPQVGKSYLSCWGVFWWLSQHPDHRVIIGSYGTTLASVRGRTIRRLVEQYGPRYGIRLLKGAKSVTNWSLISGGGCLSAGVSAGITGNPADCVADGSLIATDRGPLPIEAVVQGATSQVLSYNSRSRRIEPRPVLASRRICDRHTVTVHTAAGRRLRCTPDHLVHTEGRGYVAAGELQPGDILWVTRPEKHARTGPAGLDTADVDPAGVDYDVVRHVADTERDTVYDLQVEGNENFFADGVLVHNCFLIDDPIRSRADAESRIIREQVWDWWSGDVNSRLAPGAPVVLVNTRWHPSDLSGRLLAEEGTIDEGGRWRVVYLPAFAVVPDADRGIPEDSLGRASGEPLSHPKIDMGDTERLIAHWQDKRRSATPRDWAALWMGDPRPIEGALVTRSLLRERRDLHPRATPVKHAIAVDPSGGGRDSAGIVAGWLGDDARLYITDDRSTPSGASVEKWTREVVMLAYELDVDRIVYEFNYGKGLIRRVITTAWEDAQRRELIPSDRLMPQLVPVWARKGKILRAEPIAQLITTDRIRFANALPALEDQWCTWVPTDPLSPGALDAMVHLAYNLMRPRRSNTRNGGQGLNPGSVSRLHVVTEANSQPSRTEIAARAMNAPVHALRRRLS